MSLSVIVSFLLTALGVAYAIATFMLPEAALGRPHEPKIFPGILAACLIIFGAILLFKEIQAQMEARRAKEIPERLSSQYILQILLTIANGILYTFMFVPLGYVFSTIIFLMLQFFIFGGVGILKKGLIVSIAFSVIIYLIFNNLLGIVLPSSPLGFI